MVTLSAPTLSFLDRQDAGLVGGEVVKHITINAASSMNINIIIIIIIILDLELRPGRRESILGQLANMISSSLSPFYYCTRV